MQPHTVRIIAIMPCALCRLGWLLICENRIMLSYRDYSMVF